MEWSTKQKEIIEEARRRMCKAPWFQGVCTDHIRNLTDEEIDRIGFERAVAVLIDDTMMWDAPSEERIG